MSLPEPYFQDESCTIYHGDCREILPHLPKVDLVLTDPPYHGVVDEVWDNQWATDQEFLDWTGEIATLLDGLLADNGTVYFFASPKMAARVEVSLARHFTVIAHAIWNKGAARQGAAGSGVDISALRTYWSSTTERVIVAEKSEKAKSQVFGEYLKSEFIRAGVSNSQIAELFPSKTGRKTGCVSNWLLGLNVPTFEQYESMRGFLNSLNGAEYLRKDYKEMRRPFLLEGNDQWGQVWDFPIERERAHPTQKPLPLIRQIVKVSSRPNNIILDPFMGSGTTLRAAKDLGRKCIGIEIEEKYCEIAVRRLAQEVLPL